jgi:hypothetical protein
VDSVEFVAQRHLVSDSDLADWSVTRWSTEGRPERITGPCPSCTHLMEVDVEQSALSYSQAGAVASAPAVERITRVVECQCGQNHPQRPPTTAKEGDPPLLEIASCGRWFLVTITAVRGSEPEVMAGDLTMIQAAQALHEASKDQVTRVRAAAEKWIAGITAMLGLFSLSGVVFGKDSFAGLPGPAVFIAAAAAVVAIVAAGVALHLIYSAAYGWPVVTDLDDDEKLLSWYEQQRDAPKTISHSLRTGVRTAGIAVSCLVAASLTIWIWPHTPNETLLKADLNDSSIVCGHLVSSTSDGVIRIRRTDGTITPVKVTELQRVSTATKCP